MNEIRKYFSPFQPSVSQTGQAPVNYAERKPDEVVQDYIYCYWQLSTTSTLPAPFMYRVVSDGCVDILFEQSKRDLYITGFSTQFLEYDLGQSFDYIGIRFLPTGFPALFEVPASDLANKFIPLSDVSTSLASGLSGLISKDLDLESAADVFDEFFRAELEKHTFLPSVDNRVMNAMEQIMLARGGINLADLDVGVSERQLRRLFIHYFGESPKTFAKIVRFQNILGAKPSMASLRENKIFFDEGYYDQAHFIKEFKQFYGVTPGRAFGW